MDSSDSSINSEISNKKRKRGVRNEEKYAHNVIKKPRLCGGQYTNYKNQVIPAKTTCENSGCIRNCSTKVTEEQRLRNFGNLYGLPTKNEQDLFLQSLICLSEIKSRRPRDDVSKRINKFGNFVETNQGRTQVCKACFKLIFSVSDKRVRRLASLKQIGKLPEDCRGKEIGSRRAVSGEECLKVKEHIQSFNVKSVHYGSSQKQYLDASLDIKKMHCMFLEKYPECVNKITYGFYRKYFKENFTLSFGRPQVDTCSKCEELNTKIKSSFLSESAKRAAVGELMLHKTRAKKFYKKIETVKTIAENRDDVLAICIDYMQNLPLPHIPVQEIFYYRQLCVNEFCIHNLKTEKAIFYSYHEGIANKGPNEVCSFILHYIENFVSDNVKELHIFSDGCPGQNRNNTMVRFLLALCETKKFEKIHHYFPTRGHSFLPCDRDFGIVKRKIKRFDRVYLPTEYEEIIITSTKNNKISIYEVSTKDIIDFKTWWSRYYKRNCLAIQSLGKKVPKDKKVNFNVSTFMEFYYDSMTPGYVQACEFIDGVVKYDFKLSFGRELVYLPANRAYQDKVQLGRVNLTPGSNDICLKY